MKKQPHTFLAVTAIAVLLVSCAGAGNESFADYDIAKIYGYTYYGNITASSGNTLIPSLILYNDNRCDWNMSVTGMNNNQFYYYSVKNSASNYTLYWFSAADALAAANKDASKAAMVVQIGINNLDEIVILLTGDKLTGIGAMANTRVPMKKQMHISQNTTPSNIDYNANINDIMIERPVGAIRSAWGGNNSYSGSFVYLVGKDGKLAKGEGSCGTDTDGTEITPIVNIATDSLPNTVKITMYRFAFSKEMTVESFDIPNVEVYKYDESYYLSLASTSVQAKKGTGEIIALNELTVDGKLENGTLMLRVSFKPGKMPFPITEIFTSS
ncbi:MAG: hypothetical protein IJR50_01715 [Treponema sp.]|nr:hypothetical protein [Treponema sp.]